MKLLMITRKVDRNEHLAGFIYTWVKKISQHVDQLFVIAWQEGDSSGLPDNVKVVALPTKANSIMKVLKFEAAVRHYIADVDGVFCHQMPIYTILAAPFAKMYHKKIVSWYMHKQVDWKMKLMERCADTVLSASAESFRLRSKKLVITGHGIDIELFKPSIQPPHDHFKIISVGRISPTKDYESMIKACELLRQSGVMPSTLDIVGQPGVSEQGTYLENLKKMVVAMKLESMVNFLGAQPNHTIPNFLAAADLFINLSGTGSVDKAVLEAMASGCIVLTSNEAFRPILPAELMVAQNNPHALAKRIQWVMSLPPETVAELKEKLRQIVVKDHNLDSLVIKIVNQFKQQ